MHKCRYNLGQAGRPEVLYPDICQNQDACSDTCRARHTACQNNCGYNSECLNACDNMLNACALRAAPPAPSAYEEAIALNAAAARFRM